MLFAKLDVPDTYASFLSGPIWAQALDWLRSMPSNIPSGIHAIRDDEMFANVHGYTTLSRDACRFESHRRYLDLQYCISGGECIEWDVTESLKITDEYNIEKDVLHYKPPKYPSGVLRMSPCTFAVFRPFDGHMPKMCDGINQEVFKVVIKIDGSILA